MARDRGEGVQEGKGNHDGGRAREWDFGGWGVGPGWGLGVWVGERGGSASAVGERGGSGKQGQEWQA